MKVPSPQQDARQAASVQAPPPSYIFCTLGVSCSPRELWVVYSQQRREHSQREGWLEKVRQVGLLRRSWKAKWEEARRAVSGASPVASILSALTGSWW